MAASTKQRRNPPITPRLCKPSGYGEHMSDFLRSLPPRPPAPIDQSRILSHVATLITLFLVIAALTIGRAVFIPIAIAILLSFVLAPLVRLLRRVRVPRVPAVGLVVLLASLVLIGVAALIAQQFADLTKELPNYQTTISRKIDSLKQMTSGGGSFERAATALKNLGGQISEPNSSPTQPGAKPSKPLPENAQKPVPVEVHQPDPLSLERLQYYAGTILEPLATVGIVAVFVVFILFQREDLRDRFIRLVGSHDLQRTTAAMNDAARRLSRFFLFQTAMNASFGVIIAAGLWFIGVPSPFLCGALAALMRFVPYVGSIVAAAVPIALAAAVAPGWTMMLEAAALFLIAEPIMGQIVEPFLYGHSTGISPIAVIVSATFWTWIWGPVGLVLSTPLTVCLVVLGRHVERLEFLDVILGDAPPLTPIQSFYQRVLAADSSEIAEQAEQFTKTRSLIEYYDEIALEALLMAQLDVRRGTLESDRQGRIRETIDELIQDLEQDDVHTEAPENEDDRAAMLPGEEHSPGVSVLCIGGRTPLDQAAADLLAHLLRSEAGFAPRVEPPETLTPAGLLRLDMGNVDVVCLSYLDADLSQAHVRFAVRRLRRRFPNAAVVTCFWTAEEEPQRMHQLCEAAKADQCSTRFGQALKIVREIGSGATTEKNAKPDAEPRDRMLPPPALIAGVA
ncbi:MAG: AI-2E family transporter [Beijerinckiaceae bacterium]